MIADIQASDVSTLAAIGKAPRGPRRAHPGRKRHLATGAGLQAIGCLDPNTML